MWSDLTLEPSFKVKHGQPNLKVLISHFVIGPRGLRCEKKTYRKSWAGNLLMWSDLTLRYKFVSVLQCVGLVSSGIDQIKT